MKVVISIGLWLLPSSLPLSRLLVLHRVLYFPLESRNCAAHELNGRITRGRPAPGCNDVGKRDDEECRSCV